MPKYKEHTVRIMSLVFTVHKIYPVLKPDSKIFGVFWNGLLNETCNRDGL